MARSFTLEKNPMNYMHSFYPESRFTGFTRVDGTVMFYGLVNALLRPEFIVLDIGCGRGSYTEDRIKLRRELRILKGKVAKVIGIDVDLDAAKNEYIDEFHPIIGDEWPIESNTIDLCVSDWVLEHIEEPANFFKQVVRVLRPGGFFCARTPNAWGYPYLLSRIVPNSLHAGLLNYVQNKRKTEDIFPTYYRCNTPRTLNRLLKINGFEAAVFTHESEPAYLAFSKIFYAFGIFFHHYAPSKLRNVIHIIAKTSNE